LRSSPDRENALIDALQEVSQPRHPKHVLFTTPLFEAYSCVPLLCFRYGAHLTKEQVAQLVAPHPDTLELVSSWLKYNGVPPSSISTTHGGGWLTVAGVPVSQANKLLGASYQLYYHPGTNETILRTVGYALPAALHIHVQTIAPTTAFTSMRLLQPEEMPRSRSGGAVNATSGEP
jgi:tripeptidyl-peptidase-1